MFLASPSSNSKVFSLLLLILSPGSSSLLFLWFSCSNPWICLWCPYFWLMLLAIPLVSTLMVPATGCAPGICWPVQLLPVPETPWSHITMSFVTDLPSSSNCTIMYVVMGRFPRWHTSAESQPYLCLACCDPQNDGGYMKSCTLLTTPFFSFAILWCLGSSKAELEFWTRDKPMCSWCTQPHAWNCIFFAYLFNLEPL